MSSLTDMHVAQVVQRLPEKSRPDTARELKATLADMVEERLGDGAAPGVVVALLIATGVLTALFSAGERLLPDKAEMTRSVGCVDWSADDLYQQAPTRRIHRAESVTSLVFLALMADVPIVPSSFLHVGHLNDGQSLVNPGLWRGWLPAYFAFLAVVALIKVWKLVAGRWTAPMLVAGVLTDVAFAVFLTAAVLTQQILDPALLAGTDWSRPGWVPLAVVIVIWAVTVWDQATTLKDRGAHRRRLSRRRRRGRAGRSADRPGGPRRGPCPRSRTGPGRTAER